MKHLTINKIREIIANKSIEFIEDCHENNIRKYIVFKTFPGSGKTTSIMKEIDRHGYTWMYFAPFHDVIQENLHYSKVRDYEFTHLKGKLQEGVCLADEYKKYLKMGVSITPFCKTTCSFKDNGCPYYETLEKIEEYPDSWAGVHSHIPTYLQDFLFSVEYLGRKMYRHYDVIIIDEFPFQVLYNQIIVSRRDIDKLREVVNHIDDCREKIYFMRFLNSLSLATGTIDIDYRNIKILLENRRLNLKEFSERYDETVLDLISRKVIKEPPKNILFSFKLIHKDNPTTDRLKSILYKHKRDMWSKGGIYITTSNINYFKDLPLPIIALDATADIRAWNELLNDYCLLEEIDMKYKNLYQLRTHAHYPTSSWVRFETIYELYDRWGKKEVKEYLELKGRFKKETLIEVLKKKGTRRWNVLNTSGIRLAELIREICNRKKNSVLLCSNKKVRLSLYNWLKDNYDRENYEFANFYNLRSRNNFYENCDTCVITHEPNIPPLQLDIIGKVLNWDYSLLRDLMTISEIKQAIGRIRQNIKVTPDNRRREPIEIFMFPGSNTQAEKIVPEAILLRYKDLFVGKKETLEEQIGQIIKKLGKTTQYKLKEYLDGISIRSIRMVLMNLYNKRYISDFRRSIEWIFDEEEARRTEYRRRSSDNI